MLPTMVARLKPAPVGLGAGLLLFALPDGVGPVVVIVAALAAGWVLPSEPMTAAVLFLAPSIALGTVRAVVDDETPAIGALLLALVGAVVVTAIFTHVGAGIALRRGLR